MHCFSSRGKIQTNGQIMALLNVPTPTVVEGGIMTHIKNFKQYAPFNSDVTFIKFDLHV